MLDSGYIKIYRSMLGWEWYDDINTKVLFFHLLLTVNYEDKKWHGITIKRGQRVCSLEKLSKETKLSVQRLRTAISHLKSTGELTHEITPQCGLFTVNNYEKYQQATQPPTNEQHTANTPSTDEQQQLNKAKKDNKAKNITPLPPLEDFSEPLKTAVCDWLQYKHERHEDYKPQGLTTFLGKVKKAAEACGEAAVRDAMEIAMAANYQGIVWDRLKGAENAKIKPSRGTVL